MMWARTVVAILCTYICSLVSVSVSEQLQSRIVTIDQGPVKGYKDEEQGIYAFKGIPYASVPTGPHRFKAPLPPPTWMRPLEAVNGDVVCPQSKLMFEQIPETKGFAMKEDCLIANVYVPDTEEQNLPVLVFIHGGGFCMGYGDMSVPKLFVKENNVIHVNFNYRLGAHGFLSLGTKNAPGNAGMKDMVALLRWVKKNIHNFGGNPNDVTIQGPSSGSTSVDLLMLSKSAEGLFNKVIPESGSSISSYSIISDPLANAKKYAKFLNFTSVDDVDALEHFYQTLTFDLLQFDPFFHQTDSSIMFTPCVERPTGEEVFLDKSPVEILKSGDYRKLPVLYGFSNMEGLFRTPWFDQWKEGMNEKFSEFLPPALSFGSEKQKEEVAASVKQFYFGDKPVSEENILGYVDFFTDVIFTYATLKTVQYHLANGHDQIYLYLYSFVDENTPYVPHTDVKGADHCAQSAAVVGEIPFQPHKSEEFKIHSAVMRRIWGNFVKTGKPIPEGSSISWPPVNRPWAPHMDIGKELQLKGSMLEDRALFWDKIYSQYYKDPIPAAASSYSRTEL